MGEINKLGEELNSPVLPADATKISELESLIQQAHDHFNGKFDFATFNWNVIKCEKKGIIPIKIMTGPIKVGIFQPFHFINCCKFCTIKML